MASGPSLVAICCCARGLTSGNRRYWNCYPGARVDSDAPIYQLFDKEVWQGFSFKERYPDWKELRRYFQYLEDKLDLKQDIDFDCAVEGARFDESSNKWTVKTTKGDYVAGWFIPCIGFAAKAYTPPYKGLENFKGQWAHTAVRMVALHSRLPPLILILPAMATRRHRPQEQKDCRHRHRRVGSPDYPGDWSRCETPDRLPADSKPSLSDEPKHARPG